MWHKVENCAIIGLIYRERESINERKSIINIIGGIDDVSFRVWKEATAISIET